MDQIRLGSLTLQPFRQLLAGGEHVHLGKKALDILSVLAEANGEIVTKDELLDAVWPEVTIEENALQVHIVALRKALGPEADRLKTFRSVGYQLELRGDNATEAVNAAPERYRTSATRGDARSENKATSKLWWRRRSGLAFATLLGASLLLAAVWQSGLFGEASSKQVTVMSLSAAAETADEVAIANGITEELIVRLRRIPELRVFSGLSGRDYDGNTLQGSVRVDGEDIRVSARLEDTSGRVLWSNNFDSKLTDFLSVQEEIAAAVARTLSVSLDVGVDSREYGGTNNPEAFASYLRGRINVASTDGLRNERTRHFERAVELDPDYIRAWAGLSSALNTTLFGALNSGGRDSTGTWQAADEIIRKSDQASRRAFEANPDLIWGNLARAEHHLILKDMREAERYIQRAKEVDPGNDPEAKIALAALEIQMGRLRNADSLALAAEQIDPIYADTNASRVRDLVMLRQYEKAIALFERMRNDGHPSNEINIIHAFWAVRALEGRSAAYDYVESIGFGGYIGFLNGYRRGVEDGLFDMSEAQIRDLIDHEQWIGGSNFGRMAFHSAADGHPDTALTLFRIALENTTGIVNYYFWYPPLAELRETEEFQALIEEQGFVTAWRESGEWGDYCRPLSDTEFECF